MARNGAYEASQQAQSSQSVTDHLWEPQHNQNSDYHSRGQIVHPAHPAECGDQYGNTWGYGHAPLSHASNPYVCQYPYTVSAPPPYQNRHYAVSYNAPVSASPCDYVAQQPYASQPLYGWLGWQEPQQSSYNPSGSTGGSVIGDSTSTNVEYCGHAPRIRHSPYSPWRSRYSGRARPQCSHCGKLGHVERRCFTAFPHLRPKFDTYTDSTSVSPSQADFTPSTHQYSPEDCLSDKPGTHNSLSHVPHRLSLVTPSESCVASHEDAPYAILEEAEPTEATESIILHTKDVLKQPSAGISNRVPNVEQDTTNTAGLQTIAWPMISDDHARRLPKLDMQPTVWLDAAQSDTTPKGHVSEATQTELRAIATSSEKTGVSIEPCHSSDLAALTAVIESNGVQTCVKSKSPTTEPTGAATFVQSDPMEDGVKLTASKSPVKTASPVQETVKNNTLQILVSARGSHPIQEEDTVEYPSIVSHITSTAVSKAGSAADQTTEAIEGTLTKINAPAYADTQNEVHYDACQDVKFPTQPLQRKRYSQKNNKKGKSKKERTSNVSQPTRSTTKILSSHPVKSIKEELTSPLVPRVLPRIPAANGWGNFTALIKQNDAAMMVKAKENYERQGGDTFRPEMKETYKDQQGRKETKVHEKVSGRIDVNADVAESERVPAGRAESVERGIKRESALLSSATLKTE